MAIQQNSKYGACMAALEDGPATTADVVAETGFPSKSVGTYLYQLFRRGAISRSAFVKNPGPRKHWGSQYLWMLPEHGVRASNEKLRSGA